MPSKRIAPAAEALIDTLHAEIDTLDALEDAYEQQLEALQANDPDTLGTLTARIQDCTATLEDMSQKSKRQARLLGRVLGMEADEPSLDAVVQTLDAVDTPDFDGGLVEAREAVATRVQSVNQRREILQLSLQYAAELNHELLVAMTEAAAEGDGQTYTANGQSESGPPSDDRSFVNTVG